MKTKTSLPKNKGAADSNALKLEYRAVDSLKQRRYRDRVCCDCGKLESIRSDNPAQRCVHCSGRINGAKGLETKKANAHKFVCTHCRVEFRRSKSACRFHNNFCSWACRKAFTAVLRTCKACGCGFSVPRSVVSGKTNSRGNFCCRPCYEKWLCRTGRTTGRGSQWYKASTEARRLAPFCAICGTSHRLDVHHIVPFRLTHDNDQSNLIPLCKKCHKFIESLTHDIEAVEDDFDRMKEILATSLYWKQMAAAPILTPGHLVTT